ncbi:deoxyribonuclease-1-like 2 isoform X1 [Labrus bergylta]|uniref:deoxyribonuclease-1-like 2 isoform X1 n=1 Tax=Labrus bergylta TaxID=56723 RepID=UPI0009B3DDBC|nr:deoxyribonuclease-1-like 2 isoform X1 [Labrus bergylta]XP_020516339.1 deoxyribonuclease-1-like 2 isoform X1 [Labrus bergylta]
MRWRSLPLLLLLLVSFLLVCRAKRSEFRICAYTLQRFNSEKASDSRLMHTLTRIVSRCDITLLQEVMDPDGKAIRSLLASLNRYSERDIDRYEDYNYKVVSSKSLGTSANNMQQYVFIYRTDTVSVLGEHQYKKTQSFTREPFAVHFQSQRTAIKEFILVPLHSEPTRAVQEIDRLYDVFVEVSKKWKNTNVMFLGGFYASCAYMNRQDRKKIRLLQTKFSWLIADRVDTTVTDMTSCAYDRIVVHGQPFLRGVKAYSAKVFNFGKDLKIPRTKVVEISDHYPVEVILQSSALLLQATPFLSLLFICTVVQSFLSAL